jgi:cell division protein FtsQ
VDAEAVRRSATRAIVLPRFLRRPARLLHRLDLKMPRAFGLKALIALFIATAAAGTIIGGHGMTVASAVTAWAGFAIENVRITGQSETSEVDVLNALDIGTYPSLLTLDVEAAKARIEALPWVKQATLKKLFPDSVEIAVSERDPYAIWQHGGVTSLVDAAGKVITDTVGDRYARLPRVVGDGAGAKATAFAALIAPFPSIATHTRAGVFVSKTRWNVVLDNGMELMLPEAKPDAALAIIAALDQSQSILSREISAIDLRVPGPMIVRLTDEGLVARKAALKEREKIARSRRNT